MLRRGIAVDKGQVAGDAALIIEDNNAAAAGHFQNIAVEIEGDLAEDGQGAADVDILRQPDDIRRIVRQSGSQFCLTRYGDIQASREGDILRHSRIVVPLRAVGDEPVVEFIARLGGFDGPGGETAGTQNLNGVVFTVDFVVHGDKTVGKATDTAVAIVGDLAIDGRAAAIQVDFAAIQRYIRVNVGAFTDGHCAAVHKNVLLIHDIL